MKTNPDVSRQVKSYMRKPPFTGLLEDNLLASVEIRPEAAYLYDAVMLYVRALNSILREGNSPDNGTLVTSKLVGRSYDSAMGYKVYMDENGDAEGNYTLIGKQQLGSDKYGLVPVGRFYLNHANDTGLHGLPVLGLDKDISWPVGRPPDDQPVCGFHGKNCPPDDYCEIVLGVVGGLTGVILVVGSVAYRNWRYEQELDSLLWKIEYKELQVEEMSPMAAGVHWSRPITSQRNSQVSLSSNPDSDFR